MKTKSETNPFVIVCIQVGWFLMYSLAFYILMGSLMFQPLFFLLYITVGILLDVYLFIPFQVNVLGAKTVSYTL